MKSPFPGMDPYLERLWGDLHHSLIQYTPDSLQPQLPDDLLPRVEQRVFMESDGAHQMMPHGPQRAWRLPAKLDGKIQGVKWLRRH